MTVAGTEGGVLVRFKRVDAEYFATLDIPHPGRPGHSPGTTAPALRACVVVNESLAGRWRSASRSPTRRRWSAASVRLVNPNYENRGQSGKVEDIEIVGVIRNERVTDLESATPASSTCR